MKKKIFKFLVKNTFYNHRYLYVHLELLTVFEQKKILNEYMCIINYVTRKK